MSTTLARILDEAWRDARYALRTLRSSPTFATIAIASIALCVGANALVISVVNGLVWRPLPVSDPDRVVFVEREGAFVSHSFPAYRDMRDSNVTFEGLAGYRIVTMDVEADGNVAREWGYLATGNYFDLLGVLPVAGRLLHPSDDVAVGANPYVVLSHAYWQARFAGDASVVGSSIRINRQPYTVIGVAPEDFYGTEIFYRPTLWIPMTMQPQVENRSSWLENRNTANTWIVGRLKAGVTVADAQNDLNAISRRLAEVHGPRTDGATMRLARPGLIGNTLGKPTRQFGVGVLVLAGLVLVAACTNLAGLLAARGTDRRRELAIRASIGAGRGRIYRQLLTEALLLATAGGAAGMLIATIGAAALSSWELPIALPVQLDVRPDARVLGVVVLITLAAGLAFGLSPARQAATTDVITAMRSADAAQREQRLGRDLLVGVQVALCFALVAACVVALRGLQSTLTMPIGLQPSGVTIASFDLGLAGYSREEGESVRRQALDFLRAIPEVQDAAYANSLPLSTDQSMADAYVDDEPEPQAGNVPSAFHYQVSPGFFRTLRIRFIDGRDVEEQDVRDSGRVAVVNEAFARQILRSSDAVGRVFRYGPGGAPIEIVGVVETGKYQSLTEADKPAIFEPILQSYNSTTVLLVRSSLPQADISRQVRSVMSAIAPTMPLTELGPLDQMLAPVLLPMRVAAAALSALGLLSVMLALTGVYGLVAHAVARRQRELAIRSAVGATSLRILRLLLTRMALLVAGAMVVGSMLVVAGRGLLSSVVYGAQATDVLTLGAVAVIVALVATAACWLPVRRALHIEPAAALRD
jgi:predicted permease